MHLRAYEFNFRMATMFWKVVKRRMEQGMNIKGGEQRMSKGGRGVKVQQFIR